jgi:hypothetical protein
LESAQQLNMAGNALLATLVLQAPMIISVILAAIAYVFRWNVSCNIFLIGSGVASLLADLMILTIIDPLAFIFYFIFLELIFLTVPIAGTIFIFLQKADKTGDSNSPRGPNKWLFLMPLIMFLLSFMIFYTRVS